MLRKSLLLLAVAALGAPVPAQTLFATGFEPGDDPGYTSGASIQSVENWAVLAGDARITTDNPFSGAQAVELAANTVIDRSINASQEVVWVQGWFRGTGSAGAPEFPATPPASAIVFFSSANGIQALDGDGAGGGSFSTTGSNLDVNTWTKVALRLNYNSSTYNVYVNDATSLSNLGFRDSVSQLNGFQNLASETSFFDAFSVVARLQFDANGDENVNVGDLIAVVNEISTPNTIANLIFRDNADADLDGAINASDRTALENELLGL